MTIEEFKSSVISKASMELPEAAISFAITFFRDLERPGYYQADVADCLMLARYMARQQAIATAEERMVKALDGVRASLEEVSTIKLDIGRLAGNVAYLKKSEKRIADLEAACQRRIARAEITAIKTAAKPEKVKSAGRPKPEPTASAAAKPQQ